jgi:hypothetical protein
MRGVRAGALAGVAVLAACSSPISTPTPAPVTPAPISSLDSGPTPTPVDPGIAGQANTEWGLIWLAVPAAFPVLEPNEPVEPETGPASAAWLVLADALLIPREVAAYYLTELANAGYLASMDGPLEDGSYTTSASGSGCEILITAVPRGEDVLTTVLYGAGCPTTWPPR